MNIENIEFNFETLRTILTLTVVSRWFVDPRQRSAFENEKARRAESENSLPTGRFQATKFSIRR